MNADAVKDSLSFAHRRLGELKTLNNGDLAGTKPEDRQILIEEFFFHLVGAVEILAQMINNQRTLGLDPERVTVRTVSCRLAVADQIKSLLSQLYPTTRSGDQRWLPLPRDPYSEDGSHFRIVVYTYWVNHCGENPLHFRSGAEPNVSLILDPRNPSAGSSKLAAIDELQTFWSLVNDKCRRIIGILTSAAS
ncbi:MAG: hypothetical protein ABSF65_06370 [Candidatus Bathyarchaeia archaeon]